MSSSGAGKTLGESLGGLRFTGPNLVPADLEAFVTADVNRFGHIGGGVNCTGHGPGGKINDIGDAGWHLGMDYYLLNVIRMARHVTPIMQKQGNGSIVNISTFAAFEPDPDFPTSAVFRAGLAGYTKFCANQFAASGIRMNNVLPGFIGSLPEKSDRLAHIPTGRYGTVTELPETTAFLISDSSSYITGHNIRVDGGLTASV